MWLTGPVAPRACGIFPDQGSNPCPLHWQADSQPLRRQGSPRHVCFLSQRFNYIASLLKNLKQRFVAYRAKHKTFVGNSKHSATRPLYCTPVSPVTPPNQRPVLQPRDGLPSAHQKGSLLRAFFFFLWYDYFYVKNKRFIHIIGWYTHIFSQVRYIQNLKERN